MRDGGHEERGRARGVKVIRSVIHSVTRDESHERSMSEKDGP